MFHAKTGSILRLLRTGIFGMWDCEMNETEVSARNPAEQAAEPCRNGDNKNTSASLIDRVFNDKTWPP